MTEHEAFNRDWGIILLFSLGLTVFVFVWVFLLETKGQKGFRRIRSMINWSLMFLGIGVVGTPFIIGLFLFYGFCVILLLLLKGLPPHLLPGAVRDLLDAVFGR